MANFFFQAEDGIRDDLVTGVQTCALPIDRKSTRLNSSHQIISYAVFCLKKKQQEDQTITDSPQHLEKPHLSALTPPPPLLYSDDPPPPAPLNHHAPHSDQLVVEWCGNHVRIQQVGC